MTERIQLVIEGDLVIKKKIEEGSDKNGPWYREYTLGTVKLSNWLKEVKAQQGENFIISTLPHGQIVGSNSKGDRSCLLVQLPPDVRSFFYSPDNRLYNVAFPWILILVKFIGNAVDANNTGNKVNIYMFYRNAPVMTGEDEVLYSNMPNTFSDGRLCWAKESFPLNWPKSKKAFEVVKAIFASNFNRHEKELQWQPAVNEVKGHPSSFKEWEDLSKIDPNFVLQLPWRKSGKTVKDLLDIGVSS